MEKFLIDRLEVMDRFIACEITKVGDIKECAKIFEAFDQNNIEGVVWDEKDGRISIICEYKVEKDKGRAIEEIKEKLSILGIEMGRLSYRDDLVVLKMTGLFLEGAMGMIEAIMNVFTKRRINIEYQTISPAHFSVMIKKTRKKIAISILTKELKIRDSSVVFTS